MKTAKNIVGFIILDEGRPLRNIGGQQVDPTYRYWSYSRVFPVALFPSRTVARRVKHLLFKRYTDQANSINPETSPANRKCFDMWIQRATGLRISAVRSENPSLAELKPWKGVE